MKIDFEKLPLAPDPDPKGTAKRVQEQIVLEGRGAYEAGLDEDHVTGRFKDHDMRLDWQNGWRWEKELHAERDKCECGGCRRQRIIKRITNG